MGRRCARYCREARIRVGCSEPMPTTASTLGQTTKCRLVINSIDTVAIPPKFEDSTEGAFCALPEALSE
eukprot:2921614-Prorocentrum_lima.AAC.1